jgi:hypothetical protein
MFKVNRRFDIINIPRMNRCVQGPGFVRSGIYYFCKWYEPCQKLRIPTAESVNLCTQLVQRLTDSAVGSRNSAFVLAGTKWENETKKVGFRIWENLW